MASVWDWMPGPSGLWDYLSQYPERYRDQIREGLMQYSERPGALSAGPLVTSFNPLGPFAEDVTEQAAPLVEPLAAQQNRMYEALTGEEGQLRGEHIAGPLIGSVFRGRLPDVGKTGFFSPTSRALAKAQPKATGKQYAAAVKKEPGATAEAKQGGLIELLEEAPGTMTKEQALSMWNPVELTETVRSGVEIEPDLEEVGSRRLENGDDEYDLRDRTTGEDFVLTVDHDAGNVYVQGYGGRFIDATEYGGSRINNQGFEDGIVAIEEWIKRRNSSGPPTQYGEDQNLNLPGGTNAKEILVQLPTPKLADFDSREAYNAAIRAQDQQGGAYTGGHWDEPNVLAHIRTNERDVGGRKALHIEEIQSDWHQQGQKKGYGMGVLSADVKAAEQELRELAARYETKQAEIFAEIKNELAPFVPPTGALRIRAAEYPELKELDGQLATASRKAEDLRRAQFEGVPDAPFKKNWHELAFKRALTEAINDPSIERLTWTTGAVQADRYDLSKQVQAIRANLNSDGTYQIGVQPIDGKMQKYDTEVPVEKLPNIVGKELADKIVAEVKTPGVETGKVYSGLDLEVGGEFHKNLYDKKITQFAKKFLKKYGVEPEKWQADSKYGTAVDSDGNTYYIGGSMDDEGGNWHIWKQSPEDASGNWVDDVLMETPGDQESAHEALKKYGKLQDSPYDVWYIDITPEMREEIMTQGVPLTQRRKQMGLMAGYA